MKNTTYLNINKKHVFASFLLVLSLVSMSSVHGEISIDRSRERERSTLVPEVKVALLGDTGVGTGFGSVLSLVASEKADVVMINGDFGYGSAPASWKKKLEASIDINAFPIIGALGNHDVSQASQYVTIFAGLRTNQNGLETACTGGKKVAQGQDIILVDEVCTFGNVSIIASGIGQVLNKTYLEDRLAGKLKSISDDQWKLVGYHYTLTEMNPGLKSSSATYRFFDLIRQAGAIGAQAHTHSAMASCPISSVFAKGAPVRCHSAFDFDLEDRFVGPGVGMYVDSSLGGVDVRPRGRCKTVGEKGCGHMVDLITQDGYTRVDGFKKTNFNRFGAMFMIFNYGGDPSRALVYYKSVDGQEIFRFFITRA